MAEFILKDQYGKEQVFDHDKIFVMGTDGELVQFTQGAGDAPAVVQPLEVTENGTYTAPDGVDGFNEVVVNVDPTWKNILPKAEVGGFALDSTFGAFSPGAVAPAAFALEVGKSHKVSWDGTDYECVAFAIPLDPNQQLVAIGNASSLGLQGNGEPFLILHNQTYDNTQLFSTDTDESHVVGIWEKVVQEINLQDKTITENGEYTADEGFDGLGRVTVDVAGSGGLPAGIYWGFGGYVPPIQYNQKWFTYKGELYVMARTASGGGDTYNLYKHANGAWSTIISAGTITGLGNAAGWSYIEHNGFIHMIGCSSKQHYIFNGTAFSTKNELPQYIDEGYAFVQDGKLKAFAYSGKTVYVWDETADTWTAEAKLTFSASNFVSLGEDVYCRDTSILYKYENGATTQITPLGVSYYKIFAYKDCVYYYNDLKQPTQGKVGSEWRKYDPATGQRTIVGYGPFVGTYGAAFVLQDKLYVICGIESNTTCALMHEVTE